MLTSLPPSSTNLVNENQCCCTLAILWMTGQEGGLIKFPAADTSQREQPPACGMLSIPDQRCCITFHSKRRVSNMSCYTHPASPHLDCTPRQDNWPALSAISLGVNEWDRPGSRPTTGTCLQPQHRRSLPFPTNKKVWDLHSQQPAVWENIQLRPGLISRWHPICTPALGGFQPIVKLLSVSVIAS